MIQSLSLLKELKAYRQQALSRVVTAFANFEECVARPAIAGLAIPVEVHMKRIQYGLERLQEGKLRAKELDEAAIRRVLSMNNMKIKIEPFDILYIYIVI